MKIEISDETASQLVVDDLKASYELCLANDDTKTMEALCTVLEYYMVPDEYRQWRQNT